MPPLQTQYNDFMDAAYEGMIANTEPSNVISRNVEGDTPLQFGRAAVRGTADGNVVPATAGSTGAFVGVCVRDISAVGDQFPAGKSAPLLDRGVMWVRAGEAVTERQPVHVAADGRFVATATDNLAVPNAVFDSSGAADELVKIRLK